MDNDKKPKKIRVQDMPQVKFYAPVSIKNQLDRFAKKTGRKKNAILIDAMKKYFSIEAKNDNSPK